MDYIEKDILVHGYSDYVPFEFSNKIIELVDRIRNIEVDDNRFCLELRDIGSREVINLGRDYLKDKFMIHRVNYLSTECREKVTKSRMDPNILCRLYGRKINPFEIPVEFEYNNYFLGDLLLGYDFSDKVEVLKKMKIYFEKIYLSKKNTVINSSSYVHEIVHTQIERKGAILDHNNAEVLSIFMELLFLNDLDSSNILLYIGLINRIGDMILSYDLLQLKKDDISTYKNIKYFISTAKAIGLFEKYINANYLIKDEIVNNIQNVFDGKMTVDYFLSLFDINLEDGLGAISLIGI